MELLRRKSAEFFNYLLILELECLLNCHALDEHCCNTACSNSRAAAERFELCINYDIILYLEVHLHYVAAGRVTNLTYCVCIFYLTHVSGVCKMVYNLFCIHIFTS